MGEGGDDSHTGDRGVQTPGPGGPDGGGRPGRIAASVLWTRNLLEVGMTKGLGIMLPAIQDQLTTQTWIMGWITAMVVAMNGFIAPFAVLLTKRFEAGYIIIACGAVTGLSGIAAAFVVNPLQLAVLYALLAGSALGVMNVVCKEAVGRCFTKNYATASGFARTGYSIGLFVYAPLVQLFLNTYGWRGTMLLTGAISLHLVACGYLMVTAHLPRPTESPDYEIVRQDEHSPPVQHANPQHCCVTFWKYVFKDFDLGLLANARYWAVAVIYCCSTFAYTMWIVYFVSHAQSNGFSLLEAGTFVTVAGVANLVAKLSQGFITDRGVMSSWSLVFVCVVVSSVSYCASPWLTSYWPMMTSAILLLFSDGVLSCQNDVLIKETLGVDLLAGAFGWLGLTFALLTFALGFLPGLLYDATGSYTAGFLMIGCVQALPLVPLLALKRFGNAAQ